MFLRLRALRALALTLLLPMILLGGCATTNPSDPFEPVNRAVYRFNDTVDTAVIRPLAEGYRAVLPSFVRTGISNFFSNINDVLVALNNLLQGKVGAAVSDVGRVMINTTIGVGGLIDVASMAGMEKHNEDFGQTLGFWGIGNGPYLMLPLLGPSSLRDALGRVVDAKGDPVGFLHRVAVRNSLWGTRTVNQRAELLDTSKILETASLDPYEFLRDGYLQRRRNLIYDGSPPREKDDEAEIRKPQTGQRPNSPFPDAEPPGSPLRSGDALTPARAAALEDDRAESQPMASLPDLAPEAAPLAAERAVASAAPATGDADD